MAAIVFLLSFISVFTWVGCAGKPIRAPEATLPQPQEKTALSQLLGSWELQGKDGQTKKMIFTADRGVTFLGGLEYYNPAQWALDANRHELTITFPNAPDEKLDIFHMYIGNGVKAFNRKQKDVVYDFDEQTWSLNIAGWTYFRPDKPTAAPLAEPVLK